MSALSVWRMTPGCDVFLVVSGNRTLIAWLILCLVGRAGEAAIEGELEGTELPVAGEPFEAAIGRFAEAALVGVLVAAETVKDCEALGVDDADAAAGRGALGVDEATGVFEAEEAVERVDEAPAILDEDRNEGPDVDEFDGVDGVLAGVCNAKIITKISSWTQDQVNR